MWTTNLSSPKEISEQLASRVRTLRLHHEWTQEELASRSGVALTTLKRFEQTGKISLERLLKIAFTLNALEPFGNLFEAPQIRSLDELPNQEKARQRGRRKTKGDDHA